MKNLLIYTLLFIYLTMMVFAAAGCEPEEEEEEEEFDRAALKAVDEYIVEMGEALKEETLRADLQGWSRDYYEDDLPLYYDEERREWLRGHKETIEAVQDEHLDEIGGIVKNIKYENENFG